MLVLLDPVRRRGGARAGRRAGIPGPGSNPLLATVAPLRRGRASCSRRRLRSPFGSRAARSSARAHRRAALRGLHRGQHRRHVRHGLLARARARHRPGARRRRRHAPRSPPRLVALAERLVARRSSRSAPPSPRRSPSPSLAPDQGGDLAAAAAQNWSPVYRQRETRARPYSIRLRRARQASSVRFAKDTRYHRLARRRRRRRALPPLRQLLPERDVARPTRSGPASLHRLPRSRSRPTSPTRAKRPLPRSRRRIGAEAHLARLPGAASSRSSSSTPIVVDAAHRWFALPRDPRLRVAVGRRPPLSRNGNDRALGRDRDRRVLRRLDPVPSADASSSSSSSATRLAPGGVVVVNVIGALQGTARSCFARSPRPTASVVPDGRCSTLSTGRRRPRPDVHPQRHSRRHRRRSAVHGIPASALAEFAQRTPTAPGSPARDPRPLGADPARTTCLLLTDDYAPTDALLTPRSTASRRRRARPRTTRAGRSSARPSPPRGRRRRSRRRAGPPSARSCLPGRGRPPSGRTASPARGPARSACRRAGRGRAR